MYISVHTFKTYIMIALILAVDRASLKQPEQPDVCRLLKHTEKKND